MSACPIKALLFSAALLLGEAALGAPLFEKQELRVPGSIRAVRYGDLDGDHESDLVVSYRRGAGPGTAKFLAVFFRTGGRFSEAPSVTFRAPPRATLFDLGDAIGGPEDELLYLSAEGVEAQTFVGRRPAVPLRVIKAQTLVGAPEEEQLLSWDFWPAHSPYLILPTPAALELYRREGALFKKAAALQLDRQNFYDAERSTYRRSGRGASSGRAYALRVTSVVPRVTFAEQTGDGLADLIATYEDRLWVFAAQEGGGFAPTAVERRWFQLLSPAELARQDTEVELSVLDLNGDRIADLSASKIGGGITNLETETALYLGKKGGGFELEPAQKFRDQGFAALIDYVDLDGDGRLEMVHPYASVSVVGLTKVLLSAELGLDLRLRRRGTGSELFGAPFLTIGARYGLDFSIGGALRGALPILGHDLNGDGKPDLLLQAGADQLGIHRGQPGADEPFEETAHLTLSAAASHLTWALPRTLPTGTTRDVLIAYADQPQLEGRLIVFLATKVRDAPRSE